MLQNTPKHHFGSNGGYWVCSCENVRPNFGTPKQCIIVPKRTSFSSFCMHSGSEMLQNTPKHHFGSNRPRNSAFGYRNTLVSYRFACIWIVRCSKTVSNIILGLMDPEKVHSGTETHQFLIVWNLFG